jgi:nicotinamide-nucleotide amidase
MAMSYTFEDVVTQAAQLVGDLLLASGQTVATAESCTGGGLAEALTRVPGSSQWFGFGWVTYANNAKISQLQVSAVALEQWGAVSREVAQQMACGARQQAGSDWAVATKPVGTVWFAWAGPQGLIQSECLCFPGDRSAVRSAATRHGLLGLSARLKNTV